MAIDPNRLMDMAGNDEVVSNERIRAYRGGTALGDVAATAAGTYGVLWMQGTGVPSSQTSAGGLSLTAAQIGGGIAVLSFSAAAQTLTLDTATNIQTYMNNNSAGIQVGDIIQCLVINGGATNSFTVTPGTGGSSDGNQPVITIPANTSKTLTIRFTTVGTSPAYVVYA
jgi:hypothetical protein